MREYIYSLMTDKRNGLTASIIKALLFMVSWPYEIISSFLKFIYSIKAKKPACKVISVGNINLGGTGKTPTVCMLAKRLKGQGKTVAVLIRGYGDDEWKMIKEMLNPIPVVVGPDRVKNSRYAISEFGVDTVILDDGFQHHNIGRDLDIVLIDSTNPFGNGHLFPRGVLRERPPALKRADMVLLTKSDMGKDNMDRIKIQIKQIAPDLPIVESIYTPKFLYSLLDKERVNLSAIKEKPIAALSSIVNTKYFEFVLKNLTADIKIRFYYPDHHRYKEKDINNIIYRCNEEGIDAIVTTEKDAVKLMAYSLKLKAGTVLVLHVEPEITKGEEILDRRLLSLYSG